MISWNFFVFQLLLIVINFMKLFYAYFFVYPINCEVFVLGLGGKMTIYLNPSLKVKNFF